jgi:CheY-like chemotaxis protein
LTTTLIWCWRPVFALSGRGILWSRPVTARRGWKKVKTENPDLIILDVMMDSTTEGFHVALALRSRNPNSEYAAYAHIPIIMLTAIHSTLSLRFGPEEDYLPVDEFIDKPIDPDDLVNKVEKLLKRGK